MSHEHSKSDEVIARAMDEFRREPASSDAIRHCTAMALQAQPAQPRHGQGLRWSVRLAVATAAAAVCFALLPPRQASALDALRKVFAADDPDILQHWMQYTIHPDGRRELFLEVYTMKGRARLMFSGDNQILYDHGDKTILHSSGEVEIFRNCKPWRTVTLKQALYQPGHEPLDQTVTVDHSARLDGRTVDRFTIIGHIVDGLGKVLTFSDTVIADPIANRPLRSTLEEEGFPETAIDWDYPSYSPKFFTLPIAANARVVDHGDEKAWRANVNKNLTSGSLPAAPLPGQGTTKRTR